MTKQLLKTYPLTTTSDGQLKASKLGQAIKGDGCVVDYACCNLSKDNEDNVIIEVYGNSLADEAALDTLVQNHVAFSLADCKAARYVEIDAKTGGLISAGFVYDSKTFSLSPNAQANWNSLMDNQSEFNWPVDITTIDNDTYSLEVANISAFWNAAKNVLKGHLDSGRVLKKQIFDATDKAGVDAVVDSR